MASEEILEDEEMSEEQVKHKQRITQVCEHIWAASGILKTFESDDLQKVAWMLEDAITYIDEALTMEDAKPVEKLDRSAEDLESSEAEPISS